MQDLTKTDKRDLLEGIRKRPERKWIKAPKLSLDQQLEDELIDNGAADLGRIAKKYEKTTIEVVEICKKLGIY